MARRLIVVGVFLVLLQPYYEAYKMEQAYKNAASIIDEADIFLKSIGIKHSDVVLCQFVLETGWFTSTIYKENNNICGMKRSYYRDSTCKGVKYGHCVYTSTYDSLIDYHYWQKKYLPAYEKKYGPVLTDQDYYKFLRKYKYAEDQIYVTKLHRIGKKLSYLRKVETK